MMDGVAAENNLHLSCRCTLFTVFIRGLHQAAESHAAKVSEGLDCRQHYCNLSLLLLIRSLIQSRKYQTCPLASTKHARSEAMFKWDTAVLASTGSIPVVGVTLVDNTITESSLTSTILVILVRWVCANFTS
mmetsp:Transcript_42356/g.90101  ORF Transcript_42356/g.90101 Transcript_42356/m.90101 type:complete len:132 (+) Transcript_42356:27-422(+)